MRTQPYDADLSGRIADGFTRVSRQLRRRSADRLASIGLTDAQARLLRTIAAAERPLRMCDIAAGLGIAPRSATATVEALEVAGLVDRRADADDRRSVRVVLTPIAPPLLARLHEARCEAALEVFAPLDPVERSTLFDLLERLETRGSETGR
jgi:DNA-binding MarR family transcriptional regulator